MNKFLEKVDKFDYNIKSRAYELMIFIDSVADDYEDKITDMKAQYVISPLYQYKENGDKCQENRRILIMFDEEVESEKIIKLCKDINVKHIGISNNPSETLRNFANVYENGKIINKAHELKCSTGTDVIKLLNYQTQDEQDMLNQIIIVIDKNEITEYKPLVNTIINNYPYLEIVLYNKKYNWVIQNYLKSSKKMKG